MQKKIRKLIFPGLGLLVSIWFSVVFCFWAILGFFVTEIFVKKYIYTGKLGGSIASLALARINCSWGLFYRAYQCTFYSGVRNRQWNNVSGFISRQKMA